MVGDVPEYWGFYEREVADKVQNLGLESAMRGMSQANMNLGIFQEKKLTNGVYTRGSLG